VIRARRLLVAALLISVSGSLHALAEYERRESDIKFNHRQHYEDLDLECTQCHALPPDEQGHMSLPSEDFCLGCHDGRMAPKDCVTCHDDPEAPTSYPFTVRRLKFSHTEHLQLPSTDCLACHAGLEKSTDAQGGLPNMATCFVCHDGVRQTIACAACHTNAAQVIRDVHPVGWRDDHRIAGNENRPVCASCHRTDDRCSLCHYGDNLRGQIHPFNWLQLHAADARARAVDCTTCHETPSFCVPCHTQRFVLPLDHQTAGWLDRHGDEAKFDSETCDACHGGDQPSCLRSGCHAY
jgi:hypothetical protein